MLTVLLSGAVLSLVAAGQKLARSGPESLDQQQRARVVLQVFAAGTTAIAFTAAGCRTTVRIAESDGSAIQLAAPLGGCALDRGAGLAQGDVRTYRLDAAARQLVRRDEATGSSAPLLDGVASFVIALFADAAGRDPIAGRSDAELRRVRRVSLTLRLIASNPLLRIPDVELVVDVTPRNLQGG